MSLKNNLKHFLNRRLVNHEIVSKIAYNLHDYLKEPSSIIDVGVYHGTDFLMNAYPSSFFHLIEPNPSLKTLIEQTILKTFNGRLYQVAAGKDEGVLFLTKEEDEGRLNKDDGIKVRVEKLDNIVSNIGTKAILKVDVEGYELDVLKGATSVLRSCEIVIIELRLSGDKLVNSPQETLSYLYESGFDFETIIGEGRRKDGLKFVDALFVRRKGKNF